MDHNEKKLTEKESLELIAAMITKAKDSYHSTGTAAMMWGAVVAICALVRLAELQFGFKLPFDIYLLTLVAIIPQVLISIREKKERKVKSYDETYMDYIWLGFGICLFLLIHAVNLMFRAWEPAAEAYSQLSGKNGFPLYEYVHPLFLILYGLPTFITGAACKFRPMLWGGLFCWACSVATVYTPFKTDLLLTALSAIAAWFIPGLFMEKEYRAYKKQQAALNV
ncbi:MAG: hypothetical protein JNM88_00915 [Chitinophagaceae bacterium]|nr:hypothetical protein [Chitinophagaceae bacterium]